MKKRILSLLLAAILLCLLLPLSAASADGGSYWDAASRSFLYYEPHYGIVICRQMSVRNQPSTRGSTYCQIKNGQPVKILGTSENGDFYVLDLASCGVNGAVPGSYGFAKSALIKMDPEYYHAASSTYLYATPWGDGKMNGEQTGRFFLIISSGNGWYTVQTNDNAPGTSFIKASQVAAVYQSKYVVTWDAPVYDDAGTQIQTVKRFTTGFLTNMNGESAQLIFNRGEAGEFTAWISLQYIAPLLN